MSDRLAVRNSETWVDALPECAQDAFPSLVGQSPWVRDAMGLARRVGPP
jgi:hypothetical protein